MESCRSHKKFNSGCCSKKSTPDSPVMKFPPGGDAGSDRVKWHNSSLKQAKIIGGHYNVKMSLKNKANKLIKGR